MTRREAGKAAALVTTAMLLADPDTANALLADPNTAEPALTNSEHHHQLLRGVGPLENAELEQARRLVSPPIRAGPALSKPAIAYSVPEAARAASIGTTKLRLEIAARRLRARKIGRRTLITAQDLEAWAAALPDIHDVAPDKAAATLKDFRKSALTET
jgi:excisionase family DNA binding protein